ncbi:MAG: nitroreductase family protein [Armatimonadota bacterium]|nr:nitroreductase family protein [Armatimonadota bacterium]
MDSLLPLLHNRRSVRAFSDRPVEPEKLRQALEAARWASSSLNEQPWRWIVAAKEDAAAYERLLGCLLPGNAKWAGAAPVLLLAVARQNFDSGKENRHAAHDVGQALATLSLEAVLLGLETHQMAGFDVDKARQEFGIPDEFVPMTMMALGYAGDPESLPDDLKARELTPRTRKPLAQLVFGGEWEKSASFAAGDE